MNASHSYPAQVNPSRADTSAGVYISLPNSGASFFSRADRPTDARAGGGTCGVNPPFSMGLASLQAHVSLREAA